MAQSYERHTNAVQRAGEEAALVMLRELLLTGNFDHALGKVAAAAKSDCPQSLHLLETVLRLARIGLLQVNEANPQPR